MISVKIQCRCGQKYAFDLDPASALLADCVQCPVCGADGTETARAQIAHCSPVSRKVGLTFTPSAKNDLPPPPLPRPMPQRAPATHPGTSKQARRAVALSGLLLLAVLAAALAASHRQRHTAVSSSTSFVDDGFPHTPAEVQAWYVEPDTGRNGAVYYQKGLDALQLQWGNLAQVPIFGNTEIPSPGAPVPAQMRSSIGTVLRANQTALQYFKQGSKFEQNRYVVDLSAGADTLLMHVELIKRSSVLLELAALFDSDAQDSLHASEDLEVGLALADSLKSEPEVLAQVVRTFGVTRSMIALEQCLNRCILPNESLARLSQALHRMEEFDAQGEGFNRGLAAARANGLALLADPDKLLQGLIIPGGTSTKSAQAQLARRLEKQPSLEVEAQFFKQAVHRILAARQKDFPERIQSDVVARDELAEARSRKLTAMEALLPPFTGRATQEGECVAELRLGATAVALEQYRRAHDYTYPEALSALVPEYLPTLPLDPFQGRIFTYQKKGLGYSLRSLEAKAGLGRHSQIRPRGLRMEVFTPPNAHP